MHVIYASKYMLVNIMKQYTYHTRETSIITKTNFNFKFAKIIKR